MEITWNGLRPTVWSPENTGGTTGKVPLALAGPFPLKPSRNPRSTDLPYSYTRKKFVIGKIIENAYKFSTNW